MAEIQYILSLLFVFCFDLTKVCCTEDYLASEHFYEDYDNIDAGIKEFEKDVTEEWAENIEEEDTENSFMKILIFEGAKFRSAITNRDRLWENGTVPYRISDAYSSRERAFILKSMEEFRNKTCVRFVPRREETTYIFILPNKGCSSPVGKVTQVHRINLVANCLVRGIVLHELMHVLGFIHEQVRPDRDEFVRIDFENIREGTQLNFIKVKEAETFNQTYDYGSVMHYGRFEFAKDRSKPTVIPLQEGVEIGQRRGFSDIDLIKINLLYNCNNAKNSENGAEEKKNDERFRSKSDESSKTLY